MPRSAAAAGWLAMLAMATLAVACTSQQGGGAAPAPDIALARDARVAWIERHVVALRAGEPATDEDFADLEPLRATLGRARVVVLGEAGHGDGTTFTVKARLVRFLHEQLGYDVLAFESGFYECWKAWHRIEAGEDPAAELRGSVFRIWTATRQFQPVIETFAAAARSPHPLELTGFDPQFTGATSRFFAADLRATAEAAGLPGDRFAERVAGPLANLTEGRYESGELPSPEARADFLAALAELESRLRSPAGEAVAERAFWIRLLAGLRELAVSSWATNWNAPLLEDLVNYPVRDRVMGEHLAWLARERFPGRKIVVWMATGHAARGLAGVETSRDDLARLYTVLRPAGDVAHAQLGDEIYTVAVLSHHGRHKSLRHQGAIEELPVPSAGSLEDLLHASGFALAFLDLRQERGQPRWLREPLVASPLGNEPMRARWPEVFDGMLFIDAMEPPEKAVAAAPPSSA